MSDRIRSVREGKKRKQTRPVAAGGHAGLVTKVARIGWNRAASWKGLGGGLILFPFLWSTSTDSVGDYVMFLTRKDRVLDYSWVTKALIPAETGKPKFQKFSFEI